MVGVMDNSMIAFAGTFDQQLPKSLTLSASSRKESQSLRRRKRRIRRSSFSSVAVCTTLLLLLICNWVNTVKHLRNKESQTVNNQTTTHIWRRHSLTGELVQFFSRALTNAPPIPHLCWLRASCAAGWCWPWCCADSWASSQTVAARRPHCACLQSRQPHR